MSITFFIICIDLEKLFKAKEYDKGWVIVVDKKIVCQWNAMKVKLLFLTQYIYLQKAIELLVQYADPQ